jgi:hypothetical protein
MRVKVTIEPSFDNEIMFFDALKGAAKVLN